MCFSNLSLEHMFHSSQPAVMLCWLTKPLIWQKLRRVFLILCCVCSTDSRRQWGRSEAPGKIIDQRCSGESLHYSLCWLFSLYPNFFFFEHVSALNHSQLQALDTVYEYVIWVCGSCCSLTSVCLCQDGQTCCFLHLVLRFYVERVFSNYASSQPQDQRCSSALANAFVSIRRDIHKCVS